MFQNAEKIQEVARWLAGVWSFDCASLGSCYGMTESRRPACDSDLSARPEASRPQASGTAYCKKRCHG